MSQVSETQNPSDVPEALYPDTGESGEAYDVDYGTLLSPKPYRLSELFFCLKTPNGRLVDSESGEAYECEVKATHENGIRKS